MHRSVSLTIQTNDTFDTHKCVSPPPVGTCTMTSLAREQDLISRLGRRPSVNPVRSVSSSKSNKPQLRNVGVIIFAILSVDTVRVRAFLTCWPTEVHDEHCARARSSVGQRYNSTGWLKWVGRSPVNACSSLALREARPNPAHRRMK